MMTGTGMGRRNNDNNGRTHAIIDFNALQAAIEGNSVRSLDFSMDDSREITNSLSSSQCHPSSNSRLGMTDNHQLHQQHHQHKQQQQQHQQHHQSPTIKRRSSKRRSGMISPSSTTNAGDIPAILAAVVEGSKESGNWRDEDIVTGPQEKDSIMEDNGENNQDSNLAEAQAAAVAVAVSRHSLQSKEKPSIKSNYSDGNASMGSLPELKPYHDVDEIMPCDEGKERKIQKYSPVRKVRKDPPLHTEHLPRGFTVSCWSCENRC